MAGEGVTWFLPEYGQLHHAPTSTGTWQGITRSTEPMWRSMPFSGQGFLSSNTIYFASPQGWSVINGIEPEDPNMRLPEGF